MNALITGANRGIGLELCRLLSEKYGFKVYMGCRDTEKGRKTVESNKLSNVYPFELDVSSEESICSAARNFSEELYLLINNAAAQLDWNPSQGYVKSLDVTEELLTQIYKVNVFAPIFMCKYFFPFMKKGGRVVNVSSGSGEFGDPNSNKDFQIGYAPSKSALLMVTKKLAAAAQPFGVAVNSCCPGWCKTAMGGGLAPTTAFDGAMSVLKAAFLDNEDPPSGGYYRHGKRIFIERYSVEKSSSDISSLVPYKQIEAFRKVNTSQDWIIKFYRLFNLFSPKKFIVCFIRMSLLFDDFFYKSQFDSNFFVSGIDCIEHYCSSGWREGKNPTRWFNSNRYLELNPDVKINPFYHYLRYGVVEGRSFK